MKGLIPHRMGEELGHQANFIFVSISSDCLYRRCCQMMNLVPGVRMADAGCVTQAQTQTAALHFSSSNCIYLHITLLFKQTSV